MNIALVNELKVILDRMDRHLGGDARRDDDREWPSYEILELLKKSGAQVSAKVVVDARNLIGPLFPQGGGPRVVKA